VTTPNGPTRTVLAVHCPGCGFATEVTSRDAYSIISDLHVMACDVADLEVDGGTTDDVLRLPPQRSPLTDGCAA
jgi:hypothetical protein